MAYRYDQIEARDNSTFTKKLFGVDLQLEIVQALKKRDLNDKLNSVVSFNILKFNPQFNGYHLLINTEIINHGQ